MPGASQGLELRGSRVPRRGRAGTLPTSAPRDAALLKLDLHLRVHDPPDTEVRVELVTRRVDLDLTGTFTTGRWPTLRRNATSRSVKSGIAKKKPQSGEPFARSSAFRRAPDSL